MEVFDQFIDPTSVTATASCYFNSPDYKTLVVVKNTLLQLFKIENSRLIFINEFKLFGKILDIKPVKLQNSKLDQLLLLTEFAKLSIISYNFETNSIQTNSLHYYEQEFQKKIINKIEFQSSLKIDPNNNVSLVRNNDVMAFLPFVQDDEFQNSGNPNASGSSAFNSSIIINSKNLHPSIVNIIDCEFLYNYRQPTLAVLFNDNPTWAADLSIRKDTNTLMVLPLDLENGSSTPIMTITGLPYDIYAIKPLPEPINGMLLIGCNEIVHVDNSGNAKGLAVNKYTTKCTSFKLDDYSDFNLFLENCQLEVISSSNILVIDQNGQGYNLNFNIDGKIIKNISLNEIESEIPINSPIGITAVSPNLLFISSSCSDSLLVSIKSDEQQQVTVKDTASGTNGTSNGNYDDDDDLIYDDENNNEAQPNSVNYELIVMDNLINTGTAASLTLAKLSTEFQGSENPNINDISIITTSGQSKTGSLTIYHPTIKPVIHSSLTFKNINKTWNLLNKYLVTTDLQNFKSEIFLINDNFKNFHSLDFKNNNITIDINIIIKNRILQITSTNIFLFDLKFKKLLQINFDFEILNGKIFEKYVIITNKKGEIKIFEIDDNGKKLMKVKLPKLINELIITYGIVTNFFGKTFFLVTTVNNQILAFEHNKNSNSGNSNDDHAVYQFENIHKLSEIVNFKKFEPQTGLIPDPFIKEIELSSIGSSSEDNYFLTILTIGGEIILYKLFTFENNISLQKIDTLITGAPDNIFAESTIIERKLINFEINDEKMLFITGKQPYIVIKSLKSNPKIFKFTSSPAVSICKISNDKLIYIDDLKMARIVSIPRDGDGGSKYNYENNWPVERFLVGETINNVTFHETSQLIMISTFEEVPFEYLDEENVPIVGSIEDMEKAKNFKSSLKLVKFNALSNTWSIIDEIKFEPNELINDIKSIYLTLSSRSKRKKEFLILGIGKYRTEDLSVYGSFHIYDIISIVPDPNKPDITFKFKEIFKEVVKGAVTSVTEVSGRFLVSQGQKVIIRDLQQDNSTVPVAFFDTSTFVADSKSFGNLLAIGDALKSVWFFGFDAEPYRLMLFGKDIEKLSVSSLDFIVDNGEIFFIIADDEECLHVLTYQPDDPKSFAGQRLLRKSVIKTHTLTTNLRMLPKYEEFKEVQQPNDVKTFQNIGTGLDGSIFRMIPINEESYRRLYILQQQLSEKLSHHGGLNPKSNKFIDNEIGSKPVIEFSLIKSFIKLDINRRKQLLSKVGKNAYQQLWKDLIEVENSLRNLSG